MVHSILFLPFTSRGQFDARHPPPPLSFRPAAFCRLSEATRRSTCFQIDGLPAISVANEQRSGRAANVGFARTTCIVRTEPTTARAQLTCLPEIHSSSKKPTSNDVRMKVADSRWKFWIESRFL